MATTGQRIRELRKEQGLNLADLADVLNKRYDTDVLESSMSMYENDKRLPPVETLRSIANYFGVSTDWLMCRSDIRNPDMQLAALNYPAEVHEFARTLTQMPNYLRRQVIEYADVAAEKFAKDHKEMVDKLREKAESSEGGIEAWESRKKIKILD